MNPISLLFFVGTVLGACNHTSCLYARRGRGECAPVRRGCSTRPCAVFFAHIRGTGGKFIGEQLLNHLFERGNSSFVVEGSSLASAAAVSSLRQCQASGSCKTLTVLRHPVERVLSRYWMEGRFHLFKKAVEEDAVPFSEWVRQKRVIHAGHRKTRLWSVTTELFSKTFGGWDSDTACATDAGACRNGVSDAQFAEAERYVRADEHLVLVSEWISTPASRERLARELCFESDSRGGMVASSPPLVSDKRRPAGGHSHRRPRGWMPTEQDIKLLWADNYWDLRLYGAAVETFRRRLKTLGVDPGAGAGGLPALPPHDDFGHFHAWLAARDYSR